MISNPAAEIFDRTPPHDPLAEMSVNGAAIVNPSALPAMIEAGYRSELFHDPDNRQLAAAILSAYADHGTIDKTLVHTALKPHSDALASDPMALLIRTIDAVPHALNWPYHFGIIREHWAKRQTFLVAQRMLTSTMNGTTAADIATEVCESLAEITGGADSGKRFPSYSLADLEAMNLETVFLADDVLVKGQPALLAGAQKTLKTGIAQDLALSLATGGYFLGMFKVTEPLRVCFATGESGLATVRETFRRQCHTVGRLPLDVSGLIVSDKLPWLGGNGNDLAALRRWLMDNGAEVLFLDPVYLCLDTENKEASLFAMGKQLKPLSEVCQEIGVTLVLLHHAKRTKPSEGYRIMELSDIAFAGFPEFARQWLLISRRSAFDPDSGLHQLHLNIGGSAGHHSLWALDVDEGQFPNRKWEVTLSKSSEARRLETEKREADKQAKADERARVQLEADRKKMMRVIAAAPQTYTTIRDASLVHTSRARGVLDSLVNDKSVITVQFIPPNRKKLETGFRVRPDEPEQPANGATSVQPVQHGCNTGPSVQGSAVQCSRPSIGTASAPHRTDKKTSGRRRRKRAKKSKTRQTDRKAKPRVADETSAKTASEDEVSDFDGRRLAGLGAQLQGEPK